MSIHDAGPKKRVPNEVGFLSELPSVAHMKTWGTQEWFARQREARTENYLAPDSRVYSAIHQAFNEIIRQHGATEIFERHPDAPYTSLPLKAVVRTPSLDNWGDSYHEMRTEESQALGENAVIEIARKMVKGIASIRDAHSHSPERIDKSIAAFLQREFFSPSGNRVVYAHRFDGPRGPIFVMQDGSHRAAAAKLVGLHTIYSRTSIITDAAIRPTVWYESLALMPKEAREELLRSYDAVYPPTPEMRDSETASLARAKTYLDEIHADADLHKRTVNAREEQKAAARREMEGRFRYADYVRRHVRNRERFEHFREEAEKNPGNIYQQVMIVAADAYAQEFPEEVRAIELQYVTDI